MKTKYVKLDDVLKEIQNWFEDLLILYQDTFKNEPQVVDDHEITKLKKKIQNLAKKQQDVKDG